ncbi:MAG: LrgA family protein [Akkermansiaceae bacterium]|nr:LrgA family protein [Akkermansiaceae bacterium]
MEAVAEAAEPASRRLGLTPGKRRFLLGLLQIPILFGIWWIADVAVKAGHVPIPGGVAGLFLLWGLLGTGLIPVRWIRGGAKHLLDHLLLFFVPPMLALINHPELLGWMGLKLLLAIVVGVPLVMGGTALVVELGFRWTSRRDDDER